MNRAAFLVVPLTLALLGPFVTSAAGAEPERLSSEPFDVVVGPGPVLEITFTLTHSDVSTYPVTITAVSGSIEERLWDGTLPEGQYRLRTPLVKIKPGPVHVVVRTKITNLQAAPKPEKPEEPKKPGEPEERRPRTANQTFYSYRRWDGTIK